MRWQHFKILVLAFLLAGGKMAAQNTVLLDSMQLEETYSYIDLEEALKHPEMVVRLELRKKKLKEFPKEIFQFKNLQYLDISKNQIQQLPDSIYLLTNLQYLNVSRNKLGSLPKEIGKMSNLVYLHANNNSLIGLPPQIGNLERLRVIDLWSNELTDFPESLSKLKELIIFDIRAIMINGDTVRQLKKWMPNVNILYDPPCNCKL
ncbi:MAG TPA: leucine-rich repeat domain-containing protein [Bacteroidia bacterium]|jgi:Leucine-rich repeat (LRR) protein|nr:leucine-rich repeat domain-containing protein [Bacteroidia bacterium]